MTSLWVSSAALLLVLACDASSASDGEDAAVSTATTASQVSSTSQVSPTSQVSSTSQSSPSSPTDVADSGGDEASATAPSTLPDDETTEPNDATNTGQDEPSLDGGQQTSEVSPDIPDASASTVSCDPRKLVCRRAEPACDYGFVPRIVDGCYGACVAIDTCVCDEPAACPNEERYTCNNSRQRCTPYLN